LSEALNIAETKFQAGLPKLGRGKLSFRRANTNWELDKLKKNSKYQLGIGQTKFLAGKYQLGIGQTEKKNGKSQLGIGQTEKKTANTN